MGFLSLLRRGSAGRGRQLSSAAAAPLTSAAPPSAAVPLLDAADSDALAP